MFRLLRLSPVLLICVCVGECLAQTPSPEPSPIATPAPNQQDTIKVFTEEVIIAVRVTDAQHRFDPSVHQDELTILEDGVPQDIMSARHLPASVMLLIGTSGELNPAMKANVSKDVATHLVSRLKTGDQYALLQYGGSTKLIQAWTGDRDQMLQAIRNKLSSSKGAHLKQALSAAAAEFNATPAGNRHLVLITDGFEESSEARAELKSAVEELLSIGVTVHVISYAQMGQREMWKAQPLLVVTGKKPRKTAADIAAEIMNPIGPKIEKPKIHVIVDTDLQMRSKRARYLEALKEAQQWLTAFAVETGGTMWLPASSPEMLQQAESIANSIDSQYVVTYRPKRPFTTAVKGEYRRIEVVPWRAGIIVSARRGYVVPTK